MPFIGGKYVTNAVERADGVRLASRSSHGGRTALLKNALDHLEALADRPRPDRRDRPEGVDSARRPVHSMTQQVVDLARLRTAAAVA